MQDKEFVVTKVTVGSRADKDGRVKVGMKITSVNGKVLTGMHKLQVVSLIKSTPGVTALELIKA